MTLEHVLQLIGAAFAVASAFFAAKYGLKYSIKEQTIEFTNFKLGVMKEFEEFKEDCSVCKGEVRLHMASKTDHKNPELDEYRYKTISDALAKMDGKIDRLENLIRNGGKFVVDKGDRL